MIRKLHSFIAPLLLVLATSLVATRAQADEPDWYKVEVMMVAYLNDTSASNEVWPETLPPVKSSIGWQPNRRPSSTLAAGYRFRQLQVQAIRAIGLPVLPPANLLEPMGTVANGMNGEARRINNQPGMRVVWQKTWIEAVEEQSGLVYHPVDFTFHATNDWHVSGGFNLTVSRYLHLASDLRVQEWAQAAAVTSAQSPDLNAVRYPVRAAVIQQSRRMRSKEMHYIDHPLLGMVVYITPIKAHSEEQTTPQPVAFSD